MRELQRAFREASEPELEVLVGRHRATFTGWLRLGGPLAMRVTGMPGWSGKQFRVAGYGRPLQGENLLRRGGRLVESIPMTAQIARSRVDDRPTILIKYPPDARWPHNRVNDELRPLDDQILLGLSFGLPLAPPGARRSSCTARTRRGELRRSWQWVRIPGAPIGKGRSFVERCDRR